MHRSDYLGGQGGARVGCQPDYPDPTADEHDPPMELLACGCSLQNCQPCVMYHIGCHDKLCSEKKHCKLVSSLLTTWLRMNLSAYSWLHVIACRL